MKSCFCDLTRTRSTFMVAAGFVLLAMAAPLLAAPSTPPGNMTIDQRLKRLEATLSNQNMVDLFMNIERLQQEIQTLRGDVEVMTNDMRMLQKQQKDLYLDVDQRLTALESSAGQSGVGDGLSGEGGELGSAPMHEQTQYQAAFDLLKQSQFDEAILAFKAFQANFPSSTFGPNAQYWMGEAYYVKKDFTGAVEAFKVIPARFAQSPKVADAWLKIGFSYYELKNWKLAANFLNKVVDQHSASTAARLAERRLQQMKIDGQI